MNQQDQRGKRPRSILITGASSGIGAALARTYAAPGVTLFLGGRDPDRLAAVAEACQASGAIVHGETHDVTDRQGMAAWIDACDGLAALDLAIANAGISAGTGGDGESEDQARRIFAVNVDGTLNTILPAMERMRPRGHGQLAVMASLAAFRGFPGAPAYCASKAAIRVWGEALRGWLASEGIGVSVICPGFVKTAMSARNPFPMPFLMEAEPAARIILRGLARNRARIAFPLPVYLAAHAGGALPPSWTDRLLSRLPRKPATNT
jgi:short-subunit dehydrogenase